jgi:hypothetical protein
MEQQASVPIAASAETEPQVCVAGGLRVPEGMLTQVNKGISAKVKAAP